MNDSKLSLSKLASDKKKSQSGNASPGSSSGNSSIGGGAFNKASPMPEEAQTDQEGQRLYEKALTYITDVYERVKQKQAFSPAQGVKLVQAMVDHSSSIDFLYIWALNKDYKTEPIPNHSVNVAIFSIKLGKSLGFNRQQLIELGSSALFHDLGTAYIADNIVYKSGRLTPDEMKLLRQRPKFSRDILKSLGDDYSHLAQSVLHVYERIDGSGYPDGLQGDEIHPYAQIIGLVDIYEALIHSRPQRERFLHFSAIKEIIRSSKHMFPRNHLKALLNIFSIFPVYSFVKLNSGAIGRVMETHPDAPLRPTLQIVCDSQKNPVISERIVALKENPLLFITDSVPEDAVATA